MDSVATKKPNNGAGVFLAHLIVLVVLVVVLATAFTVYLETLWMKAEIKREAKELRKLKNELQENVK
jgi:cell division protein FtsL